MSQLLGTYDPTLVTVQFGPLKLSGLSEGDAIVAERMDKEIFKTKVGIYGEVARTRNPNTTTKVTVKLMQNSPSNAALDAVKNLQVSQPFFVKDNSDAKEVVTGPEAWVSEQPTATLGAESSEREWVFMIADATFAHIPST